MSFESFENAYKKGFLLTNINQNLELFKKDLTKESFCLEKQGQNFFFYQKGILYYFINESKKFTLKPCYTKVFGKNELSFLKHENFLKQNDFVCEKTFIQMSLKNHNLKPINFDFIEFAKITDAKELYEFFSTFFDPKYLFYFSIKDLEINHQKILLYKEENKICGALIYSLSLNTAFLEFIAVKTKLRYKNVAFALLNHYFLSNKKIPYFKLFVDENNLKAISFYKRANFDFNVLKLKFYRNF